VLSKKTTTQGIAGVSTGEREGFSGLKLAGTC